MAIVLPTRDVLVTKPYSDPDRARYGENPSASEVEWRVAATPAYGGAIIDRITSVAQIVEAVRTGRQLDGLQATTGTTPDTNVTAATYSATNPSGYTGNSLEVQATGGVSTTRGCRKACSVGASDLSVFEGGQLLKLHRRVTSNTNLTRWVIRFEFATTSDWAEYELAATGVTINTWAEVVIAKGTPRATNGTVNWALWSGNVWVGVVASGAYTGNCEVRDLRVGTVQTAKTSPDQGFAWETSLDIRARYRDDATAKATTTLAAASSIGATNVKVASIANLAIGDELTLTTAGLIETRTISAVGTAGSGGTGVTVSQAFSFAHGNGDAAAVYYWGAWSGVPAVKVSQPPTVVASTPADAATITDPTPDLVHTFSSPAGKAQASVRTDVYRLAGFAGLLSGMAPSSWWRLADASGSVTYAVGGITGTVNGGVTRAVAGLLSPADLDAGVDLDGSTGYITFGDNHGFGGTGAFSVVALIDLDTLPGSAGAILGKEAAAAGWFLYVTSTGAVRFVRRNGSGSDTLDAGSAISASAGPQLVIATYDGATLRVYVDGVLQGELASTRSVSTTTNLLTAGRAATGSSSYLDGKLDELAVFGRALSQSEISALQVTRTEAYGNLLIRSVLEAGTGLSSTLPAFLLEDDRAFAWQKTAYDTDGLSGSTALRTFLTNLSVPAEVTSLTATADSEASAVALSWTPSADANLHHHRVYWLDNTGAWIRIDGGPAALDDGLTPLTAGAFTDHRARFGTNTYLVTAHDGVLESDGVTVSVDLDPARPVALMLVTDGDERHTLSLYPTQVPRLRNPQVETLRPPGRGGAMLLRWGSGGRDVEIQARYLPSEDGDLATMLEEMLSPTAAPCWAKFPEGYLWDPIRVQVVDASDELEKDAWVSLRVKLTEVPV